MRKFITIAATVAALAAPAATSAQSGEGLALAKLSFQSLDQSGRGFVDMGEFTSYGDDAFTSIDNDDNGVMTLKEFLSWGFGMELVAEDAGKSDAYETALRVVFAFWDIDGDGQITKTEQRRALIADFQRADANGDAVLNEDEFLSGFSINVALRAAINPAAAE